MTSNQILNKIDRYLQIYHKVIMSRKWYFVFIRIFVHLYKRKIELTAFNIPISELYDRNKITRHQLNKWISIFDDSAIKNQILELNSIQPSFKSKYIISPPKYYRKIPMLIYLGIVLQFGLYIRLRIDKKILKKVGFHKWEVSEILLKHKLIKENRIKDVNNLKVFPFSILPTLLQYNGHKAVL